MSASRAARSTSPVVVSICRSMCGYAALKARSFGNIRRLKTSWVTVSFSGPSHDCGPRGVPRGLAPVPLSILRNSTPGHALFNTAADDASIRSNPVVPGANQHTCLWRIDAQPACFTNVANRSRNVANRSRNGTNRPPHLVNWNHTHRIQFTRCGGLLRERRDRPARLS